MTLREIEKEDISKAMEYIDKNGVPPGRESKKFDLVYNSKHYPPKYVISIANKYANGEELDPQEFNGGHQTNDFLRGLGFKIVLKIPPSVLPQPQQTFNKSQGTKINEREPKINNLRLLWPKVENALRKCLSQVMSRKYGKFWMEELEKKYPQLTNEFNECRDRAGAGKTKFPSNDLIKYAEASTPFKIIRLEWGSFSSIFKGHTEYSRFEREDFLVPIRNKLVHGRSDELNDEEIALAKKYFDELLNILEPYRDGQ